MKINFAVHGGHFAAVSFRWGDVTGNGGLELGAVMNADLAPLSRPKRRVKVTSHQICKNTDYGSFLSWVDG